MDLRLCSRWPDRRLLSLFLTGVWLADGAGDAGTCSASPLELLAATDKGRRRTSRRPAHGSADARRTLTAVSAARA
jgi:hypothetical protein